MSAHTPPADSSRSGERCLRLDLPARRAFVEEVQLELEPRGFDLLSLLCTKPGQVFDKQRLFDSVWAGRVVSDAALVQAIAKLRRAIEAAGGSADWIRTVHAVGYAYDGPLRFTTPAEGSETIPAGITVTGRPGRWVLWTAGLVVLLALAVLWIQRPREDPVRIAIMPFGIEARASDLEWGELALPGLVSDVLAQRTAVGTVSAHRVRGALDRMGLAADADDAAKARALREVFGVDYVLFADVGRSEQGLRIHYRVLAGSGERIEGDAVGEGAGALATATASGLAQDLDVAYAAGIPVRRISPDEFVNEAFARGMQALLSGRSRDARGYFETALRDDADAHWIRYEMGNALQYLQRWDEARAAYVHALEQAGRLGDRNLAGACRSGLGVLDWRAGKLDLAEQHFRLARADFEVAGNRANLAAAIGNLGILADNRGDLDGARALYLTALELYRLEGERAGESAVYSNLAVISRKRGKLAEAAVEQTRAAELQQRVGLNQMRVFSENHLAQIERLRGHFAKARAHAVAAGGLAEEQDDALGSAESKFALAAIALDLGERDQALRLGRDAIAAFERLQNPSNEARARMLLAELLIETDPDQAREQLRRVASIAQQSGDPSLQTQHALMAALMDPGQLAAAVSMAQSSNDPAAVAEAAWLQARQGGATEDWERAMALAQASGIPRVGARIAQDWLAQSGSDSDPALRNRLEQIVSAWRNAGARSAGEGPER